MSRLETSDKVQIAYTFEGKGPAVLLVHMLNNNKTSWAGFSEKLNKAGFSTMAIDLRGHGESERSWTTFGEQDFKKMGNDLIAASDYLKQQNVSLVAVIGASIGANLALNFALKQDVKAIVMLSPGLDYRGIKTDIIKEVKQPVLILSSKGDTYSAQSSQALHQTHGTLKLLEGDAHGTRLLDDKLMEDIISWLNENAK